MVRLAAVIACLLAYTLVFILIANAKASPFPDLLPSDFPSRDKWNKLGRDVIWDFLINSDIEFVDHKGHTVPPADKDATVQSPRLCGRVARLWIRMPFHDCGTYDARTKKGGCNGSLRKELPATMPQIDTNTSKVIFKDVFDSLGKDKKKADFAIDPSRLENTGFANSVAFFYKAKFAAERMGLKASWADTMIYSGLLSLAVCGGPHVLFVPGRVDSKTSDPPGLLPAPSASLNDVLLAYQRMGLGSLDGVTLQAAHTTACFSVGCLDTTPNKYDNQWARELLQYNPKSPKSPAVCNFNQTHPKQARCIAPFDVHLTESSLTKSYLQLLARNTRSFDNLLVRTVATAGLNGYGGFLDGVNLCTPKVCSNDQWSFFTLSSSSWFRLTSLGLPSDWVGHKYAVKKPGRLNELMQPPPVLTTGPHTDSKAVHATLKDWEATNENAEETLHLPLIKKAASVIKSEKRKP